MNEELQQLQQSIVAAVQQELTRYSNEVSVEIDRIRDEVQAGASARAALEEQIRSLAGALEQSQDRNSKYQTDLQHALEDRLTEFSSSTKRRHEEMSTRLGKVIDEANVGISATVEAAARPVVKNVEVRQEHVERELATLGQDLRRFDQQAGQIVEHINQVTQALDGRLNEVNKSVLATFDQRLADLVMRIDDVSAAAARQQSEVANIVGDRVDSAEVRINERMVGLESRMNEEIGQRVADIDAHVGHISASLDDTVVTLSDRIQKANEQFGAVEQQIAQIREEIAAVDGEAIDEMKEQIGSALGQAELVRIEMDRFKSQMEKDLEETNIRLTEVETTVQDQALDVETAVQLERLEEVERAVLMLDPDQFVRRDEVGELNGAPTADSNDEADPLGDLSDPAELLEKLSAPASAPLTPPTAEPATTAGVQQPPAQS